MEPYKMGMIKRDPFVTKGDVHGELVAILDLKLEKRGLKLIAPLSRALLAYEIHEVVMTDETDAGPDKIVDHVAYIGFFEVKKGGVVVVGDDVSLEGNPIGKVVGFDETHAPNHLNIVVSSSERKTGFELGAKIGTKIIIKTCRKTH